MRRATSALLVVDDEPQVLTAIKDLLEDEYSVHLQTSPQRALKILESDPGISVIISDQRMAEMPGDEFLTRAREHSTATRLLITGHADLKAVIRAINDGKVFGYISKPWDPNHLLMTVHKAVEYYEMTCQLLQERALLYNLMGSLPDAVFFKDRAHNYLRVNRAKSIAMGIALPEEAVGRTDAAFTDAEHVARIHAQEEQIFRTGKPIIDQIEMTRTADGVERWYSMTKAPIFNDRGEPASLVCVARDITERERSRLVVADSERRYRSLYNRTPVMMQSVDREGRLISVSEYWCEILGYSRDEVLGRPATSVMTEESRKRFEETFLTKILRSRQIKDAECQLVCKDGRIIDALMSAVAEQDETGTPAGSLAVIIDVTDKKALEGQLLQAQKMEAIGQLTGGLAHDFNNLLTVIIGNLDMVEEQVDGELHQSVESALRAAERGGALTHRLLAFSRRQTLQPAEFDLNRLIQGMEDMLRRTLGENIEIESKLQPDIWLAMADKAQVENALLNLAINSRDAMAAGGRLTIESANARLDADYASRHADVVAGDYVMLAVTDTGTGIPPEVMQRVFEPFFTTKEVGKGTGLGLSMVYGFAKQSGGHVKIFTEVGHGTAVRLYLPRATPAPGSGSSNREEEQAAVPGNETILVVEDNAGVRELAVRQLKSLGYAVIEVPDGPCALVVIESATPIDLLFTDVVMPGGIGGLELAEEARRLRPNLKVLFTSGYTRSSIVHQGKVDPGVHLLSKPYKRNELALKVREALGESR